MGKVIEAIEDLFLNAYAHTLKIEYMEGEDIVAVTVEGTEGVLSYDECDWGVDDNLAETIERVVNQAKRR